MNGFIHHLVTRVGDQRYQRPHRLGRPGPRHQLLAGGGGIGSGADQLDDFVDIGDGDGQTDQDIARGRALVNSDVAAGDHFLAEADKSAMKSFRFICSGRPSFNASIDAKTGLELGEAIGWFRTTSAGNSRLSSITHACVAVAFIANIPEMPSTRLSRTSSAMRSCSGALFTIYRGFR